jgi:hypothetical protein
MNSGVLTRTNLIIISGPDLCETGVAQGASADYETRSMNSTWSFLIGVAV